jgi:hypothetical protein
LIVLCASNTPCRSQLHPLWVGRFPVHLVAHHNLNNSGLRIVSVPPLTVFSILLSPHSLWHIFLKRPCTLFFLQIKLPCFTAIQHHNSVCSKFNVRTVHYQT